MISSYEIKDLQSKEEVLMIHCFRQIRVARWLAHVEQWRYIGMCRPRIARRGADLPGNFEPLNS